MRGHVHKRGSTWTVVYDEQPDERGKRRQRSKGGFATRREAQAFLTTTLQRLRDGSYAQPTKQTLGDFLRDEWLPAVRHGVRPLTHQDYTAKLAHVIDKRGSTPLQRLAPADLNTLYGELLDAGLAASTVRQVHGILRTALKAAVRWRYLPRNVADDADPPSPQTSAMRTWSADELRRFLASTCEHRLHALYHVLAQTGMRRGEAIGARWDDLELDAARWSVRRTLVPAKGGPVESTPKTARGQRSVALDGGTVRVLRKWRKSQLEERMAWGGAWHDTGRVFTREDGADLVPERVSEVFDALAKRAKLPRIRLHDLRHTHATLALQAGVHAKVVQERLGHASVKVTLDTYSHAIPAMQEDAAERVAALSAPNAPRRPGQPLA